MHERFGIVIIRKYALPLNMYQVNYIMVSKSAKILFSADNCRERMSFIASEFTFFFAFRPTFRGDLYRGVSYVYHSASLSCTARVGVCVRAQQMRY